MKKTLLALLTCLAMVFAFTACGSSSDEDAAATDESTEVIVFAAASMQSSLEELEASFEAENPGIDVILNCDSSGTLQEQILEGAPCDIFFSAAQKNMDALLAKAGCAGAKKEKVFLPLAHGSRDDVQFVGLNGVSFYFMRGQTVEMAQPLAEILRNTGNL